MSEVTELRDAILQESKKGNVVYAGLEGQLMIAPLDEFIAQPSEGILYDLNRSPEVVLNFLDNPRWVNDFAAGMVIRRLKEKLDEQKPKTHVDTVSNEICHVCGTKMLLRKRTSLPPIRGSRTFQTEWYHCTKCKCMRKMIDGASRPRTKAGIAAFEKELNDAH